MEDSKNADDVNKPDLERAIPSQTYRQDECQIGHGQDTSPARRRSTVSPGQKPRSSPRKSPFFKPTKVTTPTKRKPRPPTPVTLPVPPLFARGCGLIQEVLYTNPFHLLISVTFLNQTKADAAFPILFPFLAKYPTPEALVAAGIDVIAEEIGMLGLHNSRAATMTRLAQAWIDRGPPVRGRRFRVLNYPCRGDGRDIAPAEILADDDDDARSGAWEVGGYPGVGPYALDSWRVFCRDICRGIGRSWCDFDEGVEPEWKRVVPLDKELRAFLRWLWLKEGWLWDMRSGERFQATEDILARARRGRVTWDDLDEAFEMARSLAAADDQIDTTTRQSVDDPMS